MILWVRTDDVYTAHFYVVPWHSDQSGDTGWRNRSVSGFMDAWIFFLLDTHDFTDGENWVYSNKWHTRNIHFGAGIWTKAWLALKTMNGESKKQWVMNISLLQDSESSSKEPFILELKEATTLSDIKKTGWLYSVETGIYEWDSSL